MNQKRVTLLSDSTLLVGIILAVGTATFMALGTNDFFVDSSCLLISVILIIVTYFTGITAGLTFSLIFTFLQLTYVVYQYVYHDLFSYGSLFWLIMPPFYCLTIYAVTYQVRTIEEENIRLRKETSQLNALDTVTNLRTAKMHEEGFDLFSNISTRYEASLYLVVIRVAYWESIRSLLSPEQKNELLQIVTAVIKETAGDRFLPYLIDGTPPTWALLIFCDGDDGYTTRKEFRQQAQEKSARSETLRNITLTLQVSYIKYDPAGLNNALEFLGNGINSLRYDV